ncbi:MAG: hypothetical protein VXV96_10860 [Bdellovibrionota bacterium]|nr:hypothetical protein [Bdellovibrionota bacterium]
MINLKTFMLSCLFSLAAIYFIGVGIFYSGEATDTSGTGNGLTREEHRQRFEKQRVEQILKHSHNLSDCLKKVSVLSRKCGQATLRLDMEIQSIEVYKEKNKARLNIETIKNNIKKINRLAYDQLLLHYKDLSCHDYLTVISTYNFRAMEMKDIKLPNKNYNNPRSAFLATALFQCFKQKCQRVCQQVPIPYEPEKIPRLTTEMLIKHFTQNKADGYSSGYFRTLKELKKDSVSFQEFHSLIKQHYPESLKNAGVYEVREEYWLKVYNSTPQ